MSTKEVGTGMKMFAAVVVLFFLWVLWNGDTRKGNSYVPKIGNVAILDSGKQYTTVAATKGSYDRVIRLAVAGDNEGIALLAARGLVMLVPSKTEVRVIGLGNSVLAQPSHEIRILEGKFRGRSGFVGSGFLKSKR